MKIYRISLLMLLCFFLTLSARAQCPSGEVEVKVEIIPDNYPNETTWELKDQFGYIWATGGPDTTSVCVPDTLCLEYTIYDSYGDGICCGFGNGMYTVFYGGAVVGTGGAFTTSESFNFGNCSAGVSCGFADTVSTGSHTTPTNDYWYHFTPAQTGTYQIITCSTSTCDTKIWVYDQCLGLNWDNGITGTIFYNDNACALQSEVVAHLAGGTDYYIRIGLGSGICPNGVDWDLNYLGPVVGCMDTAACNYNPLASLPDTCYYSGDSLCPNGPDLLLVQTALESSLQLDQLTNNDGCLIQEGCISDYGTRDILRFTTHIKNIGNMDYYIGDPTNYPQQFTFDNCHGHWHYDGYAEYVLYDSASQPLPTGFKNGFCVLDLECSGGGTAKYGCNNMGITAGCGDIYDASLPCQWMDVTNVPAGRYTLVVRTNWDQAPDALGNYETEYSNNWAQVCIELFRDPNTGAVTGFSVDPNCPVFVDCAGQPFGSAVNDCNGICNGTALHGDLDLNLQQQTADAQIYVSDILTGAGGASSCSDLNADNDITVTDAALINACAVRGDNYPLQGGGFKDYCELPRSVTNIFDTVALRVGGVDFANQTVLIEMYNPTKEVLAYQFELSGVDISQVDNLVPASQYPGTIGYSASGTIVGISYDDSTIARQPQWQPLARVHFNSFTGPQVCIDAIVDIVNGNYEDVVTRIDGNCANAVGIEEPIGPFFVQVFPNPFSAETFIEFRHQQPLHLEVLDLSGKVIRDYGEVHAPGAKIDRGDLPAGVYLYRLTGQEEQSGKLIVR